MRYDYYANVPRGSFYEVWLSAIWYTGTGSWTPTPSCNIGDGTNMRGVGFAYAARADIRKTYAFGVPSPMTVRLDYITTSVPSPHPLVIRRYNLSYQQSNATGRSLLTSISFCNAGGSNCLTPTQF